jgi:hypothetical protein
MTAVLTAACQKIGSAAIALKLSRPMNVNDRST